MVKGVVYIQLGKPAEVCTSFGFGEFGVSQRRAIERQEMELCPLCVQNFLYMRRKETRVWLYFTDTSTQEFRNSLNSGNNLGNIQETICPF
jgi:hypothetical protein